MAPAGLSFHRLHPVPSQERARRSPFPSAQKTRPPWCPVMAFAIRKPLACSADRHSDEDKELRAEISPSLLRSLHSRDPSSSQISSGESLIERNLRKRADAQQAMEESAPASSPSDAGLCGPAGFSERKASSDGGLCGRAGFSERKASVSGQGCDIGDFHSIDYHDRPSERGSSPSSGDGDDRLGHTSSSSSAIASVFRQASPQGYDIGDFHSINYHDRPSERGSSPSSGDGDDRLGHTSSSSSAIASVFWQASPNGCDIGDFHSIDYHAYYFRVVLVSHAVLIEDTAYYPNRIPLVSLLWLLSPMQAFSIPFLESREDLMSQWARDATVKLGDVVDNKDALTAAAEFFSYVWSSKSWMERVASGKASELVMALAYSTYVYILSGAVDESSYFAKKQGECSALLNQSLAQLHGPPLDPIELWEKTLKDTPFALDGRVFVYNHAVIFPCKLKSSGDQAHFGPALEAVQNRLNKEFKNSDLVALLHRSSESHEEFFILMAPWYWVLSVDSKHYAPAAAFLCALSCLAVSQFPGVGLDFGFAWEQTAVPLGWASIVASLYFANNMRFPSLMPFPSLGAIGCLLSDYGIVSSRSSLISAVLKNACAPLAISLLLLVCGWVFWGPSQYYLASVVDFRGYVLVPPDLFSHSAILSKLLQDASVVAIQGDDVTPKLAASPIVLSGLLGLNFTAFTLFPGLHTNGGYLLKSILKSKGLANRLNLAFTVLLTITLCTKNPLLGLAWQVLSVTTEAEFFVKDDVSDIDPVSNLAGIVLVAAAIACFIPAML